MAEMIIYTGRMARSKPMAEMIIYTGRMDAELFERAWPRPSWRELPSLLNDRLTTSKGNGKWGRPGCTTAGL